MNYKILLCSHESNLTITKRLEKTITSVTGSFLDFISPPQINLQISILLCSNYTIKKLKAKWFGKKSATNVISFRSPDIHSLIKKFGPVPIKKGSLKQFLKFSRQLQKRRNGVFYLGDIAVSIEKAKEEAKIAGITANERIVQLVLHGLMHIIGYNHKTMPEIYPSKIHFL